MRRARKFSIGLVVAALVGTAFVWDASSSFAVHDTGQFELDGNINHNGTAAYDWGNLFNAAGQQAVTPDPLNGPLLASTFKTDLVQPDPTYFSGSNKDIDPIGSWNCGIVNNAQDKDDIQHAYAALVQVPAGAPSKAGHTILYVGSERDSNNGNSFAGFWLFKNSGVGCAGPGFSGAHSDGDILILSNYTNGGGTQNVQVYRWSGNDATGAPVPVPGFNGATCGVSANDNACAIANSSATVTSPWAPTSHPPQTFVEAGIDLTALLGAANTCFTTFMAETRTSQELTATLKDFAAGQFNTCPQPPIVTTATPGGDAVAPGTAQHDVANVQAVGSRPVPTGSVKFFLCGPAAVTAAGCPTGGTQVGNPVTLNNGAATSATINANTTPNDNATGKYCWRVEYTPDAAGSNSYLATSHTNAGTECFTVVHFTPSISTTISLGGQDPGSLGLTTLGDTATLTGAGPTAAATNGETVTFRLWGPYADGVVPTCTGTPAFTTTATLSNGVATVPSNAFSPTAAGTYVWTASYPGDAFNSPVTEACNQPTEKTTIVGAVIDVTKSANPPGPVSAGDDIGFDITVGNEGAGTASNVVVVDNLPAGGGGLNWTLDPAYANCSISGPVGSQVLTCNLGNVAGQTTLPVIHVTSPTTPADCGVISNTAVVTSDNAGGGDSSDSVRVNCSAMSLTKVADAASVSAGQPIGFTVTATNSAAPGTGTAKGVVINDPLPPGSGVDWSIASGSPNCTIQGTPPNEVLNCAAVDLAAGESVTVHVTSPTAFASCTTYPNTATASGSNFSSLDASATVQVRCPDLDISKSADAASVSAGTPIGFTITAENTGTGDATGAHISDTLPTGSGISWSIESSAGPLTCGIAGGVLTCSGTLGAGETETVHVVSDTVFASCGTYDNTAQLSSTVVPEFNSNGATTQVLCADLSVNKTADAATVNAGETIGFTITATNTGDGSASGALVSDTLPTGPGITWSIASSVGPLSCDIAGGVLTCTGTLGSGATQLVHITSPTGFASCGSYANLATLSADNAGTAVSSALVSTAVECPLLDVDKVADDASVSAGELIGFTITATNTGSGDATGALINDPLPTGSGVTWSIASSTGPLTCAITDGTLSCTGTLAAGATQTVHITSPTEFASCGDYVNTATLSARNGGEPVSDNASLTVTCPDLGVAKAADAATVNAGEQIGFTVTVSNSGGGTAFGVVVNDPLPAGDGVDWSIVSGPENCSISGAVGAQVLSCSSVDLAPEQSISVHVVSQTVFASCAVYPNTASATAANVPGTLSADASLQVLCPEVSVSKAPEATVVNAGESIAYTIAVENADNEGTGVAKSVTISDPLPSGPEGSGVNWSIDPAYAGPGACEITGEIGAQTLNCALGDLNPGTSVQIRVSAATSFAACAVYDNTVSLLAANAPAAQDQAAPVTVQCPALALAKTADAVQVPSGSSIGFTVTATNDGPGTAVNASIVDPLPTGADGADVSWAISPDYAGPGVCTVNGEAGSQLLACDFGSMAAGAQATVHIVSATTLGLVADCASYDNEARLTADNAPELTATATTTVVCPPAPTSETRSPSPSFSVSPSTTNRTPLAITGASPMRGVVWALGLIVLGAAGLLAAGRRNRAH